MAYFVVYHDGPMVFPDAAPPRRAIPNRKTESYELWEEAMARAVELHRSGHWFDIMIHDGTGEVVASGTEIEKHQRDQ